MLTHLTQQSNAGDTVKESLHNVRYVNLLQPDKNKLWSPKDVLKRLNKVLEYAGQLNTAIADWNDENKKRVFWRMLEYAQHTMNGGTNPLTDNSDCDDIASWMESYFRQHLNYDGARPWRPGDNNDRGPRRQRNNNGNGDWTLRGNNGNGGGRGGGNGYGNGGGRGGGSGYDRGNNRNQSRYRGGNNNDRNYGQGNRDGRGGYHGGSNQGRGNGGGNQDGRGRGRANQGQRRYFNDGDN